jgi:hypothetical protein
MYKSSKPRSMIFGLFMFIVALVVSIVSHADPVYTTELPKTGMSVRDALKTAKSGKIVFKCQRARVTESGGIGKAKNAKTVFHAQIKNDDAAQDQIIDGKKGYKCQPLEWDAEKRRLSNASSDETEA